MIASDRRVNFLGCPLDLLTSAALLDELSRHIDSRAASELHLFTPRSGENSEVRLLNPVFSQPSPSRPGIEGEVSIPGSEPGVRPQQTGSQTGSELHLFTPLSGENSEVRPLCASRFNHSHSCSRVIQFVNANKVAQVREDPDMERLIWRAHYVLADGQPILPMARLLGIRIPERIDGIGLMGKLLALANQHGYSVFLLGAKQEIVQACVSKIQHDFPKARIAGFRNGYFKPDEAPSVVAQVRAVQPDILFLGMGSPMKERFADQYASELGAAVIQGVGGSFDVMAGLVKRAPVWIQRIGFEWLYRVWQEPRRMFWRYVKTNTQCLCAFMWALLLPPKHAKRPSSGLSV